MDILQDLILNGVLRKSDDVAIREESRNSGESIEAVLLKRGVSPDQILKSKGSSLGIPTRVMGESTVPFSVLQLIPEESAMHYGFVPLMINNGVLEVGIINPDNIEVRDALNFISSKINMPFKVFLISEDDFKKVVAMYKGLSGEVTQALSELETALSGGDDLEQALEKNEDTTVSGSNDETRIIEDAPVTKIVATILHYATDGNASDIHIEHVQDRVRVRFRVDGMLHTSLILPVKVHSAVVARIKILCKTMKLDEKRKPQDGSFSAKIEGRKVDFRVSTFPAYYGEKVVIRILDQEQGLKKLEDIGMTKRNLDLVKEAVKRPYGMILISGPTGSGKSTTLYSMINEVDREGLNVVSLEDPVEYNMKGISQSQVHAEIGYTFASGLRSILRQDPNVIMVGEIRDKETAQLAIQAALTGHLVLSTIHTNSAAGIVPRLIDMGVDSYLIPPTLILGMAQRLISTVCPNSGKLLKTDGAIGKAIEKQFEDLPEEFKKEIPFSDSVLEITPSPECPNGTHGRAAVFEVFKMTGEIEKIILKNPIESEIYSLARKQGMLTMKEDALIKAFKKEVPLSEVNKL